MRKILLIFLLITSITIIGCSSDSGSSGSYNVTGDQNNSNNQNNNSSGSQDDSKMFKSIVTNDYTVYAITTDDRLYAWGWNEYGQVGNGSSGFFRTTPYEVKEVGTVKSVITIDLNNSYTVYAITTDDRLYAWGSNGYGQVGNGESLYDENGKYKTQTTPYEVKKVGTVKSLVTNGDTVYAITEDDRLYAWGSNGDGQVGNGESGHQKTPYEVKAVGKVKSVVTTDNDDFSTVYAITTDDRLYAWGDNYHGQVGNGESGYNKPQTTPYEVKEVGKVKSVVTNGSTVYAITTDDRLYAWGWNKYGQVGNGISGANVTTPYEVTAVGKVKSIVINGYTVYAITTDDKLYAWGSNQYGQVGNGESGEDVKQTTPYEVKEVGTVKSVVTDGDTVYAITTDDKLYAWGLNYDGEVGNGESGNDKNGDSFKQTTPYEVKEVDTVKSVLLTDQDTVYAITTNDRLYAWGYNYNGQVGNGSSGDHVKQTTPYEVKEVGKVKSVVTNVYDDKVTVYAITTDDKLYAWGRNEYGEVGNGYSSLSRDQTTPYEVKAVGTVKSVVTNGDTVYAITEDDKLYAWGYNKYGQVGNGESGYDETQTTPYEVIILK